MHIDAVLLNLLYYISHLSLSLLLSVYVSLKFCLSLSLPLSLSLSLYYNVQTEVTLQRLVFNIQKCIYDLRII